MRIVKKEALQFRQLQSAKTKEIYSNTAMLSTVLGMQKLFAHVDIIAPGTRASGTHRHTLMEECSYVLEGSITAVEEDTNQQIVLNVGDCVYFEPGKYRYLRNHTDAPAKVFSFANRENYDQVQYLEHKNLVPTLPAYVFDKDLEEQPSSVADYETYCKDLQRMLAGETHPIIELRLLANLGSAQRMLRKLDAAETTLLKAFTLSLDYPLPDYKIRSILRLAHVYQWKKEFAKAELLYAQAHSLMEWRGCEEPLYATLLQHHGKFFFEQGMYAKALPYFTQALRIRSQGDDPELIESSRHAMAECQKRLSN